MTLPNYDDIVLEQERWKEKTIAACSQIEEQKKASDRDVTVVWDTEQLL